MNEYEHEEHVNPVGEVSAGARDTRARVLFVHGVIDGVVVERDGDGDGYRRARAGTSGTCVIA